MILDFLLFALYWYAMGFVGFIVVTIGINLLDRRRWDVITGEELSVGLAVSITGPLMFFGVLLIVMSAVIGWFDRKVSGKTFYLTGRRGKDGE